MEKLKIGTRSRRPVKYVIKPENALAPEKAAEIICKDIFSDSLPQVVLKEIERISILPPTNERVVQPVTWKRSANHRRHSVVI